MRYSLEELKEIPTKKRNQFADLKIDTEHTKIWLSNNNQVRVEILDEHGNWVTFEMYQVK